MGKLMMVLMVVLVGCGPVVSGGDAGAPSADTDPWRDPYADCSTGAPVCPEGWTPGCSRWTVVDDRCVIREPVTCEWDGAATCNNGLTRGTCIAPVDLPTHDGFPIHCGP